MSKVSRVRRSGVSGVRPAAAPAAPDPFDDIRPLLRSSQLSTAQEAELRERIRGFDEPRRAWLKALVETFQDLDPELLVARALETPLDMAVAYSLPDIASAIAGAEVAARARLASRVARLRGLRYKNGRPVFPDPAAPGAPEEESGAQQLAGRLGELAAGTFREEAAEAAESAGAAWSGGAEGAERLERSKFLQRGRAAGAVNGPRCPNCQSHNTVVMTLQMRGRDEPATSQFFCRNCGYASAR